MVTLMHYTNYDVNPLKNLKDIKQITRPWNLGHTDLYWGESLGHTVWHLGIKQWEI